MDINIKPALRMKPVVLKNIRLVKSSPQKELSFTPNGLTNIFREDVLYDTTDMYFLKGEFQRLLLVNRFNIITKHSRTIARYFCRDGTEIEKTSDKVTEVIGQEQFNTLFTALCSILEQELKIRSILALLTEKKLETSSTGLNYSKIDTKSDPMKIFVENSCQTDEMRIEMVKPRKRLRKPISPYIVQDTTATDSEKKKRIRRIIVNIPPPQPEIILPDTVSDHSSMDENSSSQTANQTMVTENSAGALPLLDRFHDDECSNDSAGKLSTSALSEVPTEPELMTNPMSFLNDLVNQHTDHKVNMENCVTMQRYAIPGTDLVIPFKPENIFHIASADNLRQVDTVTRRKLLEYQFKIDLKHCLTADVDGNLPLHMAVLNNDVELVQRQCLVLKMKGSSLDIPANGLTALQLAVQMERPALVMRLVRAGASPLRTDSSHRTSVHDAAERDWDVLLMVLDEVRACARRILQDEDLWKPEMEKQTDKQLGNYLLNYVCSMFDKQGYTPLMLASMLGKYANVRALLEHAPSTVNHKMPTSGNTALYHAVAAACKTSSEIGNKSKVVDQFKYTIETLLKYGADPSIDNHCSGTNVNTLLQECNNAELSMLVANNYIQKTTVKGTSIAQKDFSKVMLVVDKDGNVECQNIAPEKKKKKAPPKKNAEKKLVIVEDVLLKPGSTVASNSDAKTSNIGKNLKKFNLPVMKAKEKIVLTKPKKVQAVKRKQNDEPTLIKSAKTNK